MPPSPRMYVDNVCRKCGRVGAYERLLTLWDGHSYCRTCIDEASPDLFRYAETHDVLQETLSYSAWRLFGRLVAFFSTAIVVVFGLPMVVIAWHQWSINSIAAGLSLFGIVALPVVLVFSALHAYLFHFARPTMIVQDGRVRILLGRRAVLEHELHDCEWHRGLLAQATVANGFLPGLQAILLVLPRKDGTDQTELLPVGLSSEMRSLWQGFLSLVGVPQRTLWREPSRVRRALFAALAVLAFPLGFVFSFGLAKLVTSVVSLFVREDIAFTVGFPLFVPGVICWLFWLLAEWHAFHGVPSRSTPRQRTIRKWMLHGVMIGVGILVSLVTWIEPKAGPWTSRLTCTLISLTMCALVGARVGHLFAEYDHEEARPAKRRRSE